MVYSGLEFGEYFERKNNSLCRTTVIQALTPAIRMILTLMQVQFLFLNTQVGKFIVANGERVGKQKIILMKF